MLRTSFLSTVGPLSQITLIVEQVELFHSQKGRENKHCRMHPKKEEKETREKGKEGDYFRNR